jgi:hypothetical protein
MAPVNKKLGEFLEADAIGNPLYGKLVVFLFQPVAIGVHVYLLKTKFTQL